MRKECNIYGADFNFRFEFEESDYLEQFADNLERKHNKRFEDVERLYIKDLDSKKKGRK